MSVVSAGAMWGILAAVILFASAALPRQSCAAVLASTSVSHQVNETTDANGTQSNTQDRIGVLFNISSNPSPRLSLTGILRFDVVKRVKDPGSESTEFQPNVKFRISSRVSQLEAGYRKVLRDETITSGTGTTVRSSDTNEIVTDLAVRPGRLPDVRIKYSNRDNTSDTNGVTDIDDTVTDIRASINYRLGVLAVNGDYSMQNTDDRLLGATGEKTQGSAQLSLTHQIGKNMNFSARGDYRFSDFKETSGTETKRSTTTIDARLLYSPVERSRFSGNYSILNEKADAEKTTETRYNLTGEYALPRFLRFYGSLSDRNTESDTRESTSNVTILGVNFRHAVGKFNIISRYENRKDNSHSTTGGVARDTTTNRNSFDWRVDVNLARYLRAALSEGYVSTESAGSSTTVDRYRLQLNFGPVINLKVDPYVDYTISKSDDSNGASRETTTTELVVPAVYTWNVHRNLQLTINDIYRSTTTEQPGAESTSVQSNNLTFRFNMPAVLKRISLSGDASFVTNTTEQKSTTNTSYSLRATWTNNPHSVNASYRFQTGTERAASSSYSVQYNLRLALKKITMTLQASYSYNETQATANIPKSSGQTMFVTLNLRK